MSQFDISKERYIVEEEKSLNWENLAERLQKEQPRTRYLPEYKEIWLILYPDDVFLEFWNILMTLLLLYTATVVPYLMILQGAEDTGFFIFNTIVDFLYMFDTLFNCFLAYYDSEGILVISKKKIIKNYLTGWMFIDIISCIPVELILQATGSYSTVIRIGRIPRLYRLIKMTKLVRMIKLLKSRSQMLKYISKIYKVDAAVERLIWFLIIFLLMIHILACIWIFIGEYYMYDTVSNWIMKCNLQDLSPFELYITSLYWCVTTLATVGYGDIHPFNTPERLYTSAVMVIGIFIYSYIIGSLTNLLSNVDSRKAKLTKKLEILDSLTREYGFNQAFYKKLSIALEYQHLNSKQELSDLVEDIPANLRTQLLVLIYQKILESNTFFENKPSFFVTYVAPLLKPIKYDKEEYIYRQCEYAKEMYFIVKGEVEMKVMMPNEEEIQFNTLSDSYYFGETDILFSPGKERSFSVKSITKCELLSFDHIDFENMLKKFEEESIEIMTLAHQRNQRLENKKTKAIEDYIQRTELKTMRSFPVLEIPKNVRLLDIIDPSRSNSVLQIDGLPGSANASFVNAEMFNPVSPYLAPGCEVNHNPEDEIVSCKTLFGTVIEEKLVKEEDNLKIARKKINSIENTIQECLIVLKNIAENFNIECEPGLMHF